MMIISCPIFKFWSMSIHSKYCWVKPLLLLLVVEVVEVPLLDVDVMMSIEFRK